jgi:isochorismate synthase
MIDSIFFFEKIESHFKSELPFVCFAKNGQLKAYLQEDEQVHTIEDFQVAGFIFCPFSNSESKIIFPSSHCEVISSEVKPIEITKSELKFEESNVDKIRHETLVSKAIETIKSSEIKKIVCSRKIKVEAKIDPIQVFQRLASQYSNAYCYCWYHPKVGIWLGATPEQLMFLDRNRLETVALAGTIDASKFEEPKWTTKEIEEQQMVTDFIVKGLESNTQNINISKTESVKAGQLWHLKTRISAEIEMENLDQIISDLHPTSAVCGLPKHATEQFIITNEGYDRQFYTGFLGEMHLKQEQLRHRRSKNQEQMAIKSIKRVSDLYVNLRCMQAFEDHVEIYVGGGITKDSDPKAEYEETVAKSQTLLSIL